MRKFKSYLVALVPPSLLILLPLVLMGCYANGSIARGITPWGIGLIFILFAVILLILMVGLIIWLVARKPGQQSTPGNQYLDILKERMAKGELNKKEFEQLNKELTE